LAKDGKLMSKFDSWLSGGKASGFLKTTMISVTFMADLTGLYYLIEGIKNLKKDPRTLKEIFFDTESEVEEIKNKFPMNEKDGLVKTKKTEEILKDYLISLGEEKGASKAYELSEKKNQSFFVDLVAKEKIKEMKGNIEDYKNYADKTQEAIQKIKEANSQTKTPVDEEEIYSWFEDGSTDETIKNVLAKLSSEEFSSQLSELITKHKCLATNFKYDDGYDYYDDAGNTNWVLTFEVTKPITIGGIDISKLNLDLFGGCVNVRRMRGGSAWSIHSWGAAIDVDPDNNQLKWGKDKAEFAKKEYNAFWDIVEDEGWVSLGRVKNYDWMHYQAALL
jgi:hypothetical protein